MGYLLQIRGEVTSMWYSTKLARRVGSTHAWSVSALDAHVFESREAAAKYHTDYLLGDPDVKVVPDTEAIPDGTS